MKQTISILIIALTLLVRCDNDDSSDNLNTCKNEIKFNIQGEEADYLSNGLGLSADLAITLTGSESEIRQAIKIETNTYLIDDSIIKSLTIMLHYKIEMPRTTKSLNIDSIFKSNFINHNINYITYNIENGNINEIKNYFDTNKGCVSIKMTQVDNMEWYSYNPDTMKNAINQSSSTFNISNACSNDSNLFTGTFSCMLYNRNGETKRIKQANFNFKR